MTKFLSDLLLKGTLTADGVVAFNNTATGQTVTLSDNSTKLATTAFIKGQLYAVDNTVVHLAGAETITGVKTFTANTGFGSAALNPKAELQMGARTAFFTTSSINTNLGNNVYFDGTNFRRIAADNDAPLVQLHSDGYIAGFFQTDALTAADSIISYAEMFRFNKAGNFLLGTATDSGYKATISGSVNDVLSGSLLLSNTSSGTAAAAYLGLQAVGAGGFIGMYGSAYSNASVAGRLVVGANSNAVGISISAAGSATQDIRFFVQTGEVARFSAARNLLLGLLSDSGFRLDVSGTTRVVGPSANDSSATGGEILTSAGWTSVDWTGDFATGFTHTVGNTTALSNTYSIGINQWMLISLTITNRTAGSVTVTLGGGTLGPYTATTVVGLRGFSTGALSITPTTDFNGTVVVSIKSAAAVAATSTWTSSNGTARIEIRTINGTDNTLIGASAGSRMNSAAVSNTVIGSQAGSYQVTGTFNTYVGAQAGQYATNAFNNTFVGAGAGVSTYNTSYSIYMGVNAGYNVTSGVHNVYIGVSAGSANTAGTYNNVIGGGALSSATSGNYNVGLGYQVLGAATTATATVAIGYQAAFAGVTTVTNSIFLGYNTRPAADAQTNQIVIGYNIAGLGSNSTLIGNASTVFAAVYGNLLLGGTTNNGFKLEVTGTAKISGAVTLSTLTGSGNQMVIASATGVLGVQAIPTGSLQGAVDADKNTSGSLAIGTTIVKAVSATTYSGVFFDYVVKNGTNVRVGSVVAISNGTTVEFYETLSNDIGTTTDLTFTVTLGTGNINLNAVAAATGWTVIVSTRAI